MNPITIIRKSSFTFVLAIVSLFFNASVNAQTTHYVSLSGTNISPYLTLETAATNIQNAVDAADPGDLILVNDGTYTLTTNISVTESVTIRSINGYASTIVDGNLATRCFYINNVDAVIDGFTITHGNNPGGYGGGVQCDNGTVQNCIIENCAATDGGGVALNNSGLVFNCIIRNNTAAWGGGVRCFNGTVRGCLITGNTATPHGGGINIWSGGTIQNCTITNNNATDGAGIRLWNNGIVENSIIYFNTGSSNYIIDAGTGNSLSYSCTTPLYTGTGNISDDPQFVNAGSGDYNLMAASTLIDTGFNQAWMTGTNDISGNNRIFGGTVDIGAYEYTVINTYTLSVTATNGSVIKNPNQPTYNEGTNVTLTATADIGYHFLGWSGDASGTTNPLTVTMNGNKNIKANFLPLDVIAFDDFDRANETPFVVGGNWQNPFSGGSANLISNQVAGVSGEALYYWQGNGAFDNTRQFARARVVNANGQVGLILLGGSGHAIVVAWNGGTLYIYRYSGGSYAGNLTTVSSTLQTGDIIEAVLDNGIISAKINGTLIISVANTTGITTGNPGFEFYQNGAVFDDWQAGTPASSSFTISGNITEGGLGLNGVLVTASGGFNGSTTTNGNGDYTITNVTAGATSVLLTPTLSGHTMSPLTRTITGPINSNITGQDFISTLNVNNTLTITATHGSVTKNPDQVSYSYGTNVTLTATADIGYHFLGWSGDASGTTNPLIITMDGNKNIKANFLPLDVIAFDDFDRANESPLIVGGNWVKAFGSGYVNLNNNEIAGASSEALYYWQGGGSFNNTRQFARARVVNANGQVGLILLGSNNNALVVAWNSGTLYIYWYLNGSQVGQLANLSSTIHTGDIIEAVLDGGIIYAKINGVTVHSVANTTSLTTGNPGFEFYQSGAVFDDWQAGTPASSSFTISGNITEGGLGLNGVLVTASGGFSGNATTNANGDYTITNVTAGATSVLLTPTLSGHTMSPLTRTITGPINSNITGQDFTSTLNVNNTLTITATHGSVTKNPDQVSYSYGTNVTLTATADIGYHFLGWSGDASGTTNPLIITMDGNKNIKANFLPLDVIAFDDFDRANETPFLINGNWRQTTSPGYPGNSILTSQHVMSSVGEGIYYWQGAGAGLFSSTSQYARERVVQKDGEVGLVLLGGSDQAIMVGWGPPGVGSTVYIYWYSGGIDRGQLATGPSSLVNGDLIEAVLDGGTIYAKVNGVTVLSVPNTTTLISGTPGFITYKDSNQPSQISILDDWEAGTPPLSSFTITASASAGGTISPIGAVNVNSGSNQAFTITPDAGYHIADVLVDAISVGAVSNYTFNNVTTNHTISASFSINTYTLTITSVNGTVTKDPDQANYNHGSAVQLTATPSAGYTFTGWSGDATGSVNPLTVTMDGNKNITANFAINTYTLTITAVNGTVTKNPDQINYAYGSTVELTATPSAGYTFTAWSGDATGSVNPLTVTMDANKNITANFTINTYTLTITSVNGTVTKDPDLANYNHGSTVQLTATPTAGYTFTGWSGDATGSANPLTVTMDGNKNITANYAINTYTLTITAVNGTVTKNPNQINYSSGSTVQLTATPSSGYTFTGWSGDATGSVNPLTVTMDANKNITANFTINTYTLTITSVNGTVTKDPDLANYTHGATVQLSATPSAGYSFTGWSGDATDSTNPLTVTMDGNKNITANFAINTYTLTITAVNGIVTKNPDQTNYASGSTVQLTATPSSGYSFTGWSGDATGSTNPISVTMNSNKNITANFTIDNNTYIQIGSASVFAGSSITIPVSVHFGSGSNIPQYILQGKIIFDPVKLKYRSSSIGSLFTTMGWTITGYSTIAGQFDFIATGYNSISTDGILFNLNFYVISNTTGPSLITSLPSYWLSNNSNTPALFSAINPGLVNITSQSTSTATGDVDGNFNVDFNDAIAIINHVLGIYILNGQALINADVDHNGHITLADAIGVILYCTFGDWGYTLSILSPLTSAYLSVDNSVVNNSGVVIPLNIKNTDNVRSLEVIVDYDPAKFTYDSFSAGTNSSSTITKASQVSPGQAKFVFASNELMNSDFTAGSIILKTKNGTLVNGGSIKTSYKINDGKEVTGTSINTGVTDVENDHGNGIPSNFELVQNYPNPFNPTTTIDFRVPISGYYVVKVFNAIGQTVSVLAEREFSIGNYKVTFDGNNLSSGIYFYQLFGNGVNLIKKMMLIK